MLNNPDYIRLSLETNLFWTRIMMEHAIFIEASLPPPLRQAARQAGRFKREFEKLLAETVRLSSGAVSAAALQSEIFFTRFTEAAEQVTARLTGVEINSDITRMEYNIAPAGRSADPARLERSVSALNRSILGEVRAFAAFKSELYVRQASCEIFSFQYTSVYEHIFREAERYAELLTDIQQKNEDYYSSFKRFWNQQMTEHAKVMRGLFDPTETERFALADRLAKMFEADSAALAAGEELAAAMAISNFKASTTRGIIECKVKSLMSPLFTDHILREANYYIYLLNGRA